MPSTASFAESDAGLRHVTRYRFNDVAAVSHNDLRSFVYAWSAAFDHRAPTEYFLDDADMTFNLGGEALVTDHGSFHDWYADALTHFPWDILYCVLIAGSRTPSGRRISTSGTSGDLIDDPATGATRPYSRVLRANWRLKHDGRRFLNRRFEPAVARDVIPI